MHQPHTLRILEATFNLPINRVQEMAWQKACMQLVFQGSNHAQTEPQSHEIQPYPLIQFRFNRGKAALFAINEGIETVTNLLQRNDLAIDWENDKYLLRIEQLQLDAASIGLSNLRSNYRVHRWMAFNEDNLQKYKRLVTFRDRLALLEHALTENLMALCSGLGWSAPRLCDVDIKEITHIQMTKTDDQESLVFDVEFSTDLLLPNGLGMGKSVALGYGVLRKLK
ncbi:MAG: hypothetical protein IT258_23065 [Saprospiraceae bacterium]|nr:hypothetical protein [Saprospiraceae bacterium]